MKKNLFPILFAFAFPLFSITIKAQYRNYAPVYTGDAKGSIVLFGNTLMDIVDSNVVNTIKMNDNSINGESVYGNDGENMQYTDIDGNIGRGSETRNSSTADLVLPAGTNTIKLARLYWGGRVKTSDFDLNQTANQTIKIRKGTFVLYNEFTAAQMDKNVFMQDSEEYVRYQAFTDITQFLQNNGTGTYSVGNAPLSTGAIQNGGNYGGWCIVVVFENPSLHFNSLRLYDGFEQVFDNGNPLTASITLTGLNVPPGTLASPDAKMGVETWEGDANLTGDFLKINGNLFSNAINQANNPWNGTISDNGVHVTTKNPDYTNQMGIDIDQFDIGTGYGIMPGATSAELQFGTTEDQYFPSIISFVVQSTDPALPVSLIYFEGALNANDEARITWKTALETNCSYYTVERSFDGNSFTSIATVPGNGTTSLSHAYSIINNISGVTSPVIYYRLQQVDLDGKKNYSKIIALRSGQENKPAFVSPNPFKNYFNINFDWSMNEPAVLNIIDGNGKKCLVKNIILLKGSNYIKVDGVQSLLPGSYIVQIASATKKMAEKIFKQ